MRTCLALFWLLLSLLSGATLAHAEEGNPASDLQAVESDLAASTARQVDMAKALTAALAAQEETSSALVELSARATQQEKAVASANNKLTRLERDNAKALLIRIDSPGGTTAGSEALYTEIRKVAAKKPVVAVMDTVAASGGYITAIAADHIVARGNTITGSIGVIFTYPDASKLLDTIGVKMEDIKSAELKAEPAPYHPTSDKARAVMQEMVADGFDWFKGLVSERRKIAPDKTAVLADGRVYSGRQAVANGLIDELGGEDEAMAWLAKEKKINDKLELVTWSAPKTWQQEWFGASAGNIILRGLGLGKLTQIAGEAKLDGLLVLWQPSL